MRSKIKYILIILAAILCLSGLSMNVKAASGVSLSAILSKEALSSNEEVQLDISISNNTDSIIIIEAELEYEADKLELVSIQDVEGWKTDRNGNKLLIEWNKSTASTNGKIMTITFRAKSEISDVRLSLNNVNMSAGQGIIGIGKVNAGYVNVEPIPTLAPTPTPTPIPTPTPTETEKTTTTSIPTTSQNSGANQNALPKTGENYTMLIVAVIAAVLALASFVGVKVMNKKIRENYKIQ